VSLGIPTQTLDTGITWQFVTGITWNFATGILSQSFDTGITWHFDTIIAAHLNTSIASHFVTGHVDTCRKLEKVLSHWQAFDTGIILSPGISSHRIGRHLTRHLTQASHRILTQAF
jgi:hypothetical protein